MIKHYLFNDQPKKDIAMNLVRYYFFTFEYHRMFELAYSHFREFYDA